MHVVFWQSMMSMHMLPMARMLAEYGVDCTYMVDENINDERLKQGWELPFVGELDVRTISKIESIEQIVRSFSAETIHICQGIRGHRTSAIVSRICKKNSLRWGIHAETIDGRGLKGHLKEMVYRLLILRRKPDFVLAIGNSVDRWFSQVGIPESTIFPFSYFLDPHLQNAVQPGNRSNKVRVGYVGQFIPRKHVELLFEALAVPKQETFTLVTSGSGPTLTDLQSRYKTWLEEGRWIDYGVLRQSEIAKIYNQLDVIVLPSKHDGWGVTISEGLMHGVIPICSEACGSSEVIERGPYGFIFENGSVKSLREKLNAAADLVSQEQSVDLRARVKEWAKCLHANSGAWYLKNILLCVYENESRPPAPWI